VSALLTCRAAGRDRSWLLFRPPLTLGSGDQVDLHIDADGVAREIGRLERADDEWRLVCDDGTHLEVEGAVAACAVLRPGVTVRIGDATLSLETNSAPDDAGAFVDTAAPVDFRGLSRDRRDETQLRRLLEVLARISESDAGGPDESTLAATALDALAHALPAQRAFVVLSVAGGAAAWLAAGRSRGGPVAASPSRTIVDLVLSRGVAVLSGDAVSEARFLDSESIHRGGVRSVLAAPIWTEGGTRGAIVLDDGHRAWAFDASDRDLLSAVGHHLAVAFQRCEMQKQLLRQALFRQRLERYVPADVVPRLERMTGDAHEFVTEQRTVTVLFADVVGFTGLAESRPPGELVAGLNELFGVMSEEVFREHGLVDKFIGDAMMAVFGAPLAGDDHARRAVRAAWRIRERAPRCALGVQIRIGVHTGRVVSGDVGAARRRDFTVLGPTVNIAARIESVVAQPGTVCVSSQTLAELGEEFTTRPLGPQRLRGVAMPVECHEVTGQAAPIA